MGSRTVMTSTLSSMETNSPPLMAARHSSSMKPISFQINCDDQEEVDYYWEKLGEGGDEKAQQCGWLKDKYGLSWQVDSRCFDRNAER